MSIQIMAEVWNYAPEELTDGELLFLLALADQAGDQDRCAWPGMRVLMQRSRAKRSSVYNYVGHLQNLNIIRQVSIDEAPKRHRGASHRGHETIIWGINPVSEWCATYSAGTGPNFGPQNVFSGPSHGTPEVQATGPEPTTQPPGSSKGKTTTDVVVPRRRASRHPEKAPTASTGRKSKAGAGGDEDDGLLGSTSRLFAAEKPEPGSKPPRTAFALATFFKMHQDAYTLRTGDTRIGLNHRALTGYLAGARRLGVTNEVLAQMIEEFFDDEKMLAGRGPLWKVFARNAENLRSRTMRRDTSTQDSGKERRGSIPKHLLEQILDEFEEEKTA